jgi:hypothetical protein
MEHGAWSMEHGAWSMGHGAWSMGHGAWSMGHGAWSMEHGAWSMEHNSNLKFRSPQSTILSAIRFRDPLPDQVLRDTYRTPVR